MPVIFYWSLVAECRSNRWRQARRSNDALWTYLSRVGVRRRRNHAACVMCRKGLEDPEEEAAAVWLYECTHLVHQRCALSRSIPPRSSARMPVRCLACESQERRSKDQPPRKMARWEEG